MSYSFYNGTFAPTEEITVPLTDRALYFGDGIYDAAIGRNGKIFLLDEHLDRFFENAQKISIKPYYSRAEIIDIFKETIKRASFDSFFLYFQLSRKGGKRQHSFNDSFGSNLLVTVSELPPPDFKHIDLVTFEDRRFEYCNIKTLNLLPSVLAAAYAEENGCYETVFHRGDTVTECAHSNISILMSGKLITHPTDSHILPGITRKHLINAAKELEMSVVERPFALSEMFCADEVIVTSTTKLITCADRIDGNAVGGKDGKNLNLLYKKLLSEYCRETC